MAAKFDPVNRLTEISFTHYQRAASLSQDDAKRLIERAVSERWSVREVQREVRAIKADCRPPIQPLQTRDVSPPRAQMNAARLPLAG